MDGFDIKKNSQILAATQPNSDTQNKPLLDGVDEEKYGTDSNVIKENLEIKSYANYLNNASVKKTKKTNKYKIYQIISICFIFGLMTVSIYFNNVNNNNHIIEIIISILWCIRIIIRIIGLYTNERWYFQKKSKFKKLKAELFKMKQFGKIVFSWIILLIIGYVFIIAMPFIQSLCGSFDATNIINHLMNTIVTFIISLLTIWSFNICLYWYCDHHIQRINSFVLEIGNKKVYRSSISNKNVIEISASNIIQINSSNTCIEQEINYTKQLWSKWVTYSFVSDIIYLLFIVSVWLFINDNIIVNIYCKNSIGPQIISIFYFECLGFIGLVYGIVKMNACAKSKILEKTVKELGCKYDKYNNKDVISCIQQQIIFQSFYVKLKEFPVGFEVLETKIYWRHFYVLLLFLVVLWMAVMLRLNV